MNTNVGKIIDKADYCLFPDKAYAPDADDMAYRNHNLNIFDYMEQAATAKTMADIYKLCDVLRQYYGFSCFGACLLAPRLSGKPVFSHLYTECDWTKHYIKKNLLRVDPFVRHCVERVMPISWKWADKDSEFNSSEKQVIDDARDFGVTNIITIPWHGPSGEMGGMKMTNTNGHSLVDRDIQYILPTIVTASHSIHAALYRIIMNAGENNTVRLSPREQDVLSWSALGKDSSSIAQILNISENTVNTHLKNAYQKLNVRSRQHAVAKAVGLKLIHI